MSGAPVKRSHEEGGHSSSLKFPPNEDTGSYPKLTSGVSNEYHLPYEMGPDARLAKIPRSESRDVHRRSPLHSIYRMPPSSNESHMDSHLNFAPETRLESRDSMDSRDYCIENHDTRTDAREMNGEARRDSRSGKNERDVRLESRGDDNKEVKHDREAHLEPKNDVKIGKDDFGPAIIQVRGGQLWGTDIYTNDSDLVAVLMHTGYFRPTASPPPPAIQELHATIRVLPPQDSYTSMLRNNVRSRAWGAVIGCSYRVERCCIVKVVEIFSQL